jgi:hypothetical protein
MLWSVQSQSQQRLFCGPMAVAALIGVDADEVVRVIQDYRSDWRPVRSTRARELEHAFQCFGFNMRLISDLSTGSPTLAAWERGRTNWAFERPLLLMITGHWAAVRGQWFCDTFSGGGGGGTPVRLKDATLATGAGTIRLRHLGRSGLTVSRRDSSVLRSRGPWA